ncbi:outer membrane lipoprotein chaperone LolA [Marinicella rhabdoformis]|uniref:outer membrane lipoprotein chaperone LolA n=1 Tax=Marinicella rhabdoformis TaxID=2580566 RepID=UPI0012AECC96|nr:outer membrane lipoprotein chaperone LolA [Marinicella rhabdoformis]
MKKIKIVLILMWSFQLAAEAPQTDPQVLLAEVRDGLSTMRAEFTQFEVNEDNKHGEESHGLVWLKAPSQFRWHYKQPIEQLIIADGHKVWVYDEDLEQVTVKKQNNQLNPIYVIINKDLSNQHYNIKFETESNGTSWISLTPKKQSEEVKTVWLALKDKQLSQIKVVNHLDQTMIFEFHDSVKNPKLEDDLFQFSPPEGVDVIQAPSEQTGGEF